MLEERIMKSNESESMGDTAEGPNKKQFVNMGP